MNLEPAGLESMTARVHSAGTPPPLPQGVLRARVPYPPRDPVQLPAQAAAQGPVDQARGRTLDSVARLHYMEFGQVHLQSRVKC